MLFEGKGFVVTGAGRGIGRAIALDIARRGGAVVVCDLGCGVDGEGRDPSVAEGVAEEIRAMGGTAFPAPFDVGRSSDIEALFELSDRSLPTFDGLVTAAGIQHEKSLFDLEIERFESVVRTHLTGTFLPTQAAARRFKKQRRGGSIVHLVSAAGFLGSLGQTGEAAAKAGIYGLTRTASIELQRYGVRVNAVAPLARTRQTEDLPIFEKVRGTLEPEHVAPVASFLLSELAREVSGVALSVAGGRISSFQLTESSGRLKEIDGGVWTPEEIAENFLGITRV